MITCLSPNGRTESQGEHPADEILVATIRGLYVLTREPASGQWAAAFRGLENRHISSLLYEPHGKTLFAGLHGYGDAGGLYASTDGGCNWQPRMDGLDRLHVYTLAAERRGGETILYAGVEPAALYRSHDQGRSWTELPSLREVPGTEKWIFPPPPHIAHVKNVALHPQRPGELYVCVEQGALLKSIDDGATWRELDGYASESDSFYRDVHRVAIARHDPRRVHLATGDGLYFSADAGEHWEHQQRRTDRVGYPDALFLDPRDDSTVYLGGAGDAPETWRVQGGAQAGFVASHDRGKTWTELMDGLPDPIHGNIEAMAMHAWPHGLAFYAGTAVGDVFGSEDGGRRWSMIAHGLPPISKARHYRHFLSAEEKKRLEDEGRAERRAQGLEEREYRTNA